MPTAVADLWDSHVRVLDAGMQVADALRHFKQSDAAYVVVSLGGWRFYPFPAAVWRDRLRSVSPTATLETALALDQTPPDLAVSSDAMLTLGELQRLVAEVERADREAITVVADGSVVGVVPLAVLRRAVAREELFGQPSGRGAPATSAPPLGEAPSPPAPARTPPRARTRRGTTRSARPRSAPPPDVFEAVGAREAAEALPHTAGAEPPGEEPTGAKKRTVEPRAEVDFPAEVVVGETNALCVSLSTLVEAPGLTLASIKVAEETQQVTLQISVQAPGFAVNGPNVQDVVVPVSGDADPVDFMLKALPGPQGDKPSTIRVRFRYEGKFLGQVVVQAVVKPRAEAPVTAAAQPPTSTQLVVSDTPAPDFLIEVNKDDDTPGDFHIYVQSNIRGRRYYQKEVGTLALGPGQTAASYTSALFESIQLMDPETAELELAGIGNRLWDKLPQAFRDEYWSLLHDNPAAHSIQIITDEAYIPWELLKPYKLDAGRRLDATFWGMTFAIGRWDPARPLPQPLTINSAHVVVPDYRDPRMKLPFAQREIAALQTICGARSGGCTRKDVVELLRSGGLQLLHFACHGKYHGENPDLSELEMEDQPLSAMTIAAAAGGVAADRPFVFLNACEVGKEGVALTQLGGWAETFCANGFSGFVGPLWEVDDEVAYEASVLFYQALVDGSTLGEALQRVRRQWSEGRRELRFSPTWLAYSLHSDPMLKLAWPARN